MSVPSSVEELLALIRKSGMIDDPKLTAYLQRRQMGRGPLPNDAREAADAMVADGVMTNFQAEQFLLGKWRGFTIGKYKLLERVGVGGMGQVFLCEHMFMKRRVAVKVLPPAKAEQPAALGRFYREARAAGSLDHPNIVRTHDIDQDGNLHFIVMEYVDGSNLLDMVKKFGPMDVRRACGYVRQVAVGLEFAFKNGLIHRDVKPGNILVDRRGVARVLDMGLARFFRDQTDMLTVKYDDKIVLGTADYVAPEQVANSHAVDVRADVYGLGATLYFLLAGHPPFPTGTVSQKLLWHRTKEPTPIRQIRPEVPEGVAAIVTRMMAKDPAQRFQTPGEAAQALAAWVAPGAAVPSAAEMPQLCPAVMEVLAAMAEQSSDQMLVEDPSGIPVLAAVGAGAAESHAPAGGRPYGPPAGSYAQPANPFTAPRAGSRPPMPGLGGPPASGYRPSPAANPFTPRHNATPLPLEVATPSRHSVRDRAGGESEPREYKLTLLLILAATIAGGGGLVYWKFVGNVGTPAPVPVTAPAPANP